jgi:hypothetical protein
MEVRETCVMTFLTSLEGQKRVRINAPRAGLVRPSVDVAANMLISVPLFDDEIGNLVSLVDAEFVTETRVTVV